MTSAVVRSLRCHRVGFTIGVVDMDGPHVRQMSKVM